MTNPLKYSVFHAPAPFRPLGLTYAGLARRWYEWVQSIRRDENPVIDISGSDCHQKQQGPVWFLTGTGGGSAKRVCTIPKGRPIFLPIINEMSTTSQYKIMDDELIKYCGSVINQVKHKKVVFDDHCLEGSDLDPFRVRTELFDIDLIEHNLCGVQSGPTQAVCDGYWIMVRMEALYEGNHTLYSFGEQNDGFKTEVTYYLTIQ